MPSYASMKWTRIWDSMSTKETHCVCRFYRTRFAISDFTMRHWLRSDRWKGITLDWRGFEDSIPKLPKKDRHLIPTPNSDLRPGM